MSSVQLSVDSEVSRRLLCLGSPEKLQDSVPLEEYFSMILRKLDPEKYKEIDFIHTDIRWIYTQACIDVLRELLDWIYSVSAQHKGEKATISIGLSVCLFLCSFHI